MTKSGLSTNPAIPRILVVDDEAAICLLVAVYFQKKGFNTITASNAADAYGMLEQEQYDAIITDVSMPGEDGVSLLGRIHKAWPDIPVILMTGYADMQMAIDAIKLGAFDFVQKPFDLDYLVKVAERAVHYSRLQRLEKHYIAELEQAVASRTSELMVSEERYHAIIEDQDEMICRYLPDGRLSFVNGAYARYYGVNREELIGRNFTPDIPEPDVSMITKSLSGITPDTPVVEFTHRIISPQGELRWQHWTQRGIYSVDGTLLEYQAVGTDTTENEMTRETLLFLLQCGLHPEEDFFESLARYLAQTLNMDYVCIDSLHGEGLSARTLAVFHDGKFEDSVEYTLKDTPCGDVVGKTVCIFPESVRTLFPEDAALQELRAESYVGATLWSPEMKPIGLIAVISRQPLTDPALPKVILKLVSIRAAAELIRRQAEEELRKSEKLARGMIDKLEDANHALTALNAELKKTHREAEHSNKVLNAILENMADWAWEVDTDWRYTLCSSHVVACLGFLPDEMIGMSPLSLMLPAEIEKKLPLFSEACRLKLPIQNLEYWNVAKDGQSRLILINAVPITDESDNLTGYRGVARDITDLRHIETELRKLLRAVTQSPVTTVITDLDGKIEYVNPKFCELTGYSSEDVIGQNPRILNSGFTPQETYKSMWAALSAGGTWEGEFHNQGKHGQQFWEHAVISALRDESGTITHYLAVKENITEKKAMIQQLNEAKDKAEKAVEAKSYFLSTMSHEIRTPMNGVIGMTGLLLDTALTPEQRDYAEIVRKSGENLLSLINEILDFSKIEAGKLELELLEFDLRNTVEDTAELLSLRGADKGLDLFCSIDPQVPMFLKGDPGRVRQILTNLIGNAVKFTHHGEVLVNVKFVSEQDKRVTVLFEIHDTGIGIPAERLDAIFTPFTQVDASTSRKYEGTGLGLAISKQLSELMGGHIGVTSNTGIGSTFWFTAVFEKAAPTNVSAISESAAVPLADISGISVLVVTTSATNSILLTTLLQQWGCRYGTAKDGENALALLREAAAGNAPYRIILTDQKLPGMSGSELGRQIKEDQTLKSTLMIMVTGVTQRGDAAALNQIGFGGYLVKPVRRKQLHNCITLLLGRSAAPPLEPQLGIITRHTVAECAGQNIRILVAEDNIINQKVALNCLSKLGYKSDVVANGREAVRALELIDYDLVLMDCMMPEMDGYEATAMIRSADSSVRNHAVPVIAMTANAMSSDREVCLQAGMNDYLAKPVRKENIAVMIEKWIPQCGSATA